MDSVVSRLDTEARNGTVLESCGTRIEAHEVL